MTSIPPVATIYKTYIPSPSLFSLSISNYLCHLSPQDEKKDEEFFDQINGSKDNFWKSQAEIEGHEMNLQDDGEAVELVKANLAVDEKLTFPAKSLTNPELECQDQISSNNEVSVFEETGRKRRERSSKPPRGRPRKKPLLDSSSQDLIHTSPVKSSYQESTNYSEKDLKPSPGDIFSTLPLDSIELPLASGPASFSDIVEFPLRSSSLIEWNIADEDKPSDNFSSSVWEEQESEHRMLIPGCGDEILETSLLVPKESYSPDSPSLPLLSINNSRSWSPDNSKSEIHVEDLNLHLSDEISEKNGDPKVREDDDKAMSSFVDKYLNLNSSFPSSIDSRTNFLIQKGRRFISSLPSRSQKATTPILPFISDLTDQKCEYHTPPDIANFLSKNEVGASNNLSNQSLPSETSSSIDSTSIDFSEYFSPDEIHDIMTLVQDEHQEPLLSPENQLPILQPLPHSHLTIYRTTPPKRGRKRKYDPNKPIKPSRQRIPSFEAKVGEGPFPNGKLKDFQNPLGRLQPAETLSPEDEQFLFSQYHSSQARQSTHPLSAGYLPYQPPSYESQIPEPYSYPQSFQFGNEEASQRNGEVKLQGLIGLKLVLNSVRTPSFSRSSSYGRPPQPPVPSRLIGQQLPIQMNRADNPS